LWFQDAHGSARKDAKTEDRLCPYGNVAFNTPLPGTLSSSPWIMEGVQYEKKKADMHPEGHT
jgi:hypothetical protein